MYWQCIILFTSNLLSLTGGMHNNVYSNVLAVYNVLTFVLTIFIQSLKTMRIVNICSELCVHFHVNHFFQIAIVTRLVSLN